MSALKIKFFDRALLAKLLKLGAFLQGHNITFIVQRSKHFSVILSFAIQRDATKKQELDQLEL